MNIWREVEKMTGQTLNTLDQHKPFEVIEVTEHAVVVQPRNSQTERQISRDAIENAYSMLATTGQITRTQIRSKFSEFNPAYVAAILAALPNVKHSLRPIRLWITKDS